MFGNFLSMSAVFGSVMLWLGISGTLTLEARLMAILAIVACEYIAWDALGNLRKRLIDQAKVYLSDVILWVIKVVYQSEYKVVPYDFTQPVIRQVRAAPAKVSKTTKAAKTTKTVKATTIDTSFQTFAVLHQIMSCPGVRLGVAPNSPAIRVLVNNVDAGHIAIGSNAIDVIKRDIGTGATSDCSMNDLLDHVRAAVKLAAAFTPSNP